MLDKYELSKQEKERIVDRINRVKELVEAQPKSLQWKMRSKVGISKLWYNKVEEVQRD
jgi:hypothetical protein